MGGPRAAERARATTLSYPRPACKEAVARAAVARDAHRAACARRRARTRHPECACHVVPRAPRLAVATKHVTPLGSTVNRCGYMRADQRHCDAVARRGCAAVHPRTIKSRALPTTPGQPPRHSTAATGSEMPGARGLQKQLCAAEQPTPWPDLVAGAAASCGAACVLPASRLLRRVLVMMTAYSAARPFVCCPRQLLWRACFVPCSCCCCCGCWLATAGRGAACTPAMSRRPLCQLQVVVATCRAAVQGCCPRPRRCQRQLDAAAAAKPSSALCH